MTRHLDVTGVSYIVGRALLDDVTLTFRKEYPKFLNYAGERYQ